MIEVVTIFAPRGGHEQHANAAKEYLPLLELQRKSVEKFGHRHVIVSDQEFHTIDVLKVPLPDSLMKLQIAGQIAYLEQWSGTHPVLFVDADCLVARGLSQAFVGKFDIGLTSRPDHASAQINNGAMYVNAGSKEAALKFYRHALTLCGDHWGGDQEAVSQAAAPVLEPGSRDVRSGAVIEFLSMKSHNAIPRIEGVRHKSNPFVVHFKGRQRKPWMKTYADLYVLK